MRIKPALMVSSQICALFALQVLGPKCRTLPGDHGYPLQAEWAQLNSQVGGRLLTVVPSAKYCHDLPSGNCTYTEWISTTFRGAIPGAMDNYNWEQDYTTKPPSVCFQNGTTCGQGNVPVYAINASSAADIQAGVRFAAKHNLKVAVKASGHDFLGRSTAKGSLLLWTHYLRNINFTDSFLIGGKSQGSAVTIGSGVPLNSLYAASKAVGKFYVGGTAAVVVPAGGYIQGGGHSAFGPLFGMASDNALEFNVVTADGQLVTANQAEHSDLFWALRGGGAGSWGVIVSATLRTFPTFNATLQTTIVAAPSNLATAGQLAELHARHIFDWDGPRAGQYFYVVSLNSGAIQGSALYMVTYFANYTADQATVAMKPLIDDATSLNYTIIAANTTTALVNDLVFSLDDTLGENVVLGSRLIPAEVYRNNVTEVGKTYDFLLRNNAEVLQGHLVAGGKVSDNANVTSALNPKWRSAKAHVLVSASWPDNSTLAQINQIKDIMTNVWVPALANLTGESDSGAYSNEADVREPNFQVTFFGSNYKRLVAIKKRYDPNDMFIVSAGVGSENWDAAGSCRKN